MWSWLVATDQSGTRGIVTEASSKRTVERFIANAELRCAMFQHIKRQAGDHWDGSRLDTPACARIVRGIRRNNPQLNVW